MRLRVWPSTPAVSDPRFRFTRSHATSSVAGSQRRLNRSPKRLSESSPAQRCSLACHPSTRCSASFADSGAGVFTSDLPKGFSSHGPAAALPHVAGSPDLGVLRRLRHAPCASADSAPCPATIAARRARGASHVHRDPFDRIGIWLYPCNASAEHSQHLHGHHARRAGRGAGPPGERAIPLLPNGPIRQVAGRSLIKGLRPPVRLRYASRSRLRARRVWQYRGAATLSGRSRRQRALPRYDCPQLLQAAASARDRHHSRHGE